MDDHGNGNGNGNGNGRRAIKQFNGVKVFSATMAAERERLGDKVTDWLHGNPGKQVVDTVVTQSSDEAFHCIAITVFFWQSA
jgi:hypothetical protein